MGAGGEKSCDGIMLLRAVMIEGVSERVQVRVRVRVRVGVSVAWGYW